MTHVPVMHNKYLDIYAIVVSGRKPTILILIFKDFYVCCHCSCIAALLFGGAQRPTATSNKNPKLNYSNTTL